MIRSFGEKAMRRLFQDQVVLQFQGIARRAKRKLEAVNAAASLEDLKIPPSNHLEALRGELRGYHSIRVNDQWRVIFRWVGSDTEDVAIVDYH